ncbi:MAG: InlB B-repeat-containing protein, partial [Verrucomicrobiota bacterium]
GASVTVTATANAGYAFVNWTEGASVVSSAATYTFTVGADQTLVANFTPQYTVATSASPAAGGSTSGGGTFNSGTSVTVSATANAGYAFANWTEGGTVVSATASFTFTLVANRTLVANFNPVLYTITTAVSPAGTGSVTGGGSYPNGASVTLWATPNAGIRFIGWTEGPTVVGTATNLTFTASASRTLVANFGPQLPTGWAGQIDIGAPGTAGNGSSNSIAPNSFLIVAGAGNISGKADNFRYLYQTLTGDGSITVRVPSFQNTGTSARVGVMIRDALNTGSVTAFLGVNGSGAIQWVRRTRAGNNPTVTASATVTAPNVWLRITRTGSTFTAARSTDGTTWTTIASEAITMVANPSIGIAVASGTTALNTATFSNVTVIP